MDFSWLEDFGEAVIDVGSEVVLSQFGGDAEAEAQAQATATPSTTYPHQQESVAVDANGAPLQQFTITKPTQETVFLIGGSLLALAILILALKR